MFNQQVSMLRFFLFSFGAMYKIAMVRLLYQRTHLKVGFIVFFFFRVFSGFDWKGVSVSPTTFFTWQQGQQIPIFQALLGPLPRWTFGKAWKTRGGCDLFAAVFVLFFWGGGLVVLNAAATKIRDF